MEDKFAEVVNESKTLGLSLTELRKMLELLYEEV